jgi:hypothetical protein
MTQPQLAQPWGRRQSLQRPRRPGALGGFRRAGRGSADRHGARIGWLTLELGRTSPHDAYTPSMAFAVSFPPHDPRFGPNKQIFSGEASYEISAAAVLTITHEQAGKLRQRHFAPGSWLEVEDNVDPPE